MKLREVLRVHRAPGADPLRRKIHTFQHFVRPRCWRQLKSMNGGVRRCRSDFTAIRNCADGRSVQPQRLRGQPQRPQARIQQIVPSARVPAIGAARLFLTALYLRRPFLIGGGPMRLAVSLNRVVRLRWSRRISPGTRRSGIAISKVFLKGEVLLYDEALETFSILAPARAVFCDGSDRSIWRVQHHRYPCRE